MSLMLQLIALKAGPLLGEAPRSGKWPAVEREHLRSEPFCKFCGATQHLQVHHIKPFHLFPQLELDPGNLITLCMTPAQCHLRQGHLGNWSHYNPQIRAQATRMKPSEAREMLALLAAWAFSAIVDGPDLIVINGRGTCFGGDSDPQDDGSTASGINTKDHPNIAAVSLPMRGEMFAGLNPAEHAALDGSPIPLVEWLTLIDVAPLPADLAGQTLTVIESAIPHWETFPVIDLGPAHRTGNAIDLTPAAARRFDPNASAVDFAQQFIFRVRGGALALPS